ncbi:MAG: TraC family protein [Bdellovibrionales bacterium]|nr:TraC family protein [Bdellovibrionales bacterium]
MLSQERSNSLGDQLPFWHPHQNYMVYEDGSLGASFKLQGLDISLATPETINSISQSLSNLIKSASEGLRLQFFYRLTPNVSDLIEQHATQSRESIDAYQVIQKARLEQLKSKQSNHQFFSPELYIFIRSQTHTFSKTNFWQSTSKFVQITEKEFDSHLSLFERNVKQIESSLGHVGLKPTPLNIGKWFLLLYETLNLDRSLRIGSLQYRSHQDFTQQLTLTDVIVHPSSIQIGKLHFRSISLHTLPEGFSYASMIDQLLKLSFHCWISQSIEIPNLKKEMEKLEVQRRLTHSMASGANKVRDLESETKLQQVEELSKELLEGSEKLIHCGINIVIWDEAKVALEEKSDEVLKNLTRMNQCEGIVETYAGFEAFMSNLPGMCKPFRKKKMKSSNAAHLVPAYGYWQGNQRPVCLLPNRDLVPFSLDPFAPELPNWNGMVFGGSGSGKSFTISQLMLQFYGQKPTPKIVWIDNGASSKRLLEVLGGEFIDLHIDSKLCLNMFDLPKGQKEPSPSKIKLILAVLETILKDFDQKGLPKRDKALLEELIFKTYEVCPHTPTLSDFRKHLMEHESPSMKAYAQTLYPWTGNTPYGKLLDGQSTVNINKDLVTIEIKGLDTFEDLQNVFLLLFTDFIQSEASRELSRPYLLIIDEAWKLFETPSGLSFTLEAYRTFRKFNAGIWAISQNYKDFLSSQEMANAIFPNTTSTFILKQRGIDWNDFQATLQLSDTEVHAVQNLSMKKGEYSELFYMQDMHRTILKLMPDPLSYWICTTDPQDKKRISDIQQQFPTLNTLEVLKHIINPKQEVN